MDSSYNTIEPYFNQPYVERSEGKKLQGKIIKPQILDHTVPSIPTAITTTILNNRKIKGFGGSVQRFNNQTSLTPGPGAYESNTSAVIKNLESQSTRGFDSLSKRGEYKPIINKGPGPGAYNAKLSTEEIQKKMTNISSFLSASSRLVKPFKTTEEWVGPGKYNPRVVLNDRERTYNSSFSSKVTRQIINPIQTPSPGDYEVLKKCKSDETKNISAASFSKHAIVMPKKKDLDHQEVLHKLETGQPSTILKKETPGPDTYDVVTSFENLTKRGKKKNVVEKDFFPEKNQTILQDFIKKKTDEKTSIGPGYYYGHDTYSCFPDQMYEKSSFVFLSETRRGGYILKGKIGPCAYNPKLLPLKTSCLKNDKKLWV